jgi:hypothetical protein
MPSLSSVGAKLAGTTVVLIALATLGIYLRLSEYQRESLLHAKELSAIAVTRLSADSCAAAVVFERLWAATRRSNTRRCGRWTPGAG